MAETSGKSNKSKWVKPVLAVSLALNLLVAGAVGGAVWRHGSEHDARGGAHSRAGEARSERGGSFIMLRALERDDRRAILRSLKSGSGADTFSPRAHMQTMLEVLRAEPLEPAKMDALIATQQAAGLRRQEALALAWRDTVVGMTQAERVAYADRLEGLLRRGGAKRH